MAEARMERTFFYQVIWIILFLVYDHAVAQDKQSRIILELEDGCRRECAEEVASQMRQEAGCDDPRYMLEIGLLSMECHHATQVEAAISSVDINVPPRIKRRMVDATVEATYSIFHWGQWGISRLDQCREVFNGPRSDLLQYDPSCYPQEGGGVTIVLIDTGCRETHNVFYGRNVLSVPAGWPNQAPGNSAITDGVDGNGHGTHVAGIAAGHYVGVARRADVFCVKALDDSGRGLYTDVMLGLNLALQKSAQGEKVIVNFSLAGPYDSVINSAVDTAVRKGVLVVSSAGNNEGSACLSSPASSPSSLTVTSCNYFEEISPFANWGTCVDVIAPGEYIMSASNRGDSSTALMSGTSMAAPHVSGLAALMMSSEPNLTPENVTSAIRKLGVTLETSQGGFHLPLICRSTC